jgi:hypothetical protein
VPSCDGGGYLFAGAQAALLAAQRRLAGSKETRVFNGATIAVGKKHLQTDIQTNRSSIVSSLRHITSRGQLAHNQRIPVAIGPLDQVTGLGHTFEGAVPLDLDRCTEFVRDAQHATVEPHVLACGELPQLDAVPLVTAVPPRPLNSAVRSNLLRNVPVS